MLTQQVITVRPLPDVNRRKCKISLEASIEEASGLDFETFLKSPSSSDQTILFWLIYVSPMCLLVLNCILTSSSLTNIIYLLKKTYKMLLMLNIQKLSFYTISITFIPLLVFPLSFFKAGTVCLCVEF